LRTTICAMNRPPFRNDIMISLAPLSVNRRGFPQISVVRFSRYR
jgi:hypothetical protein